MSNVHFSEADEFQVKFVSKTKKNGLQKVDEVAALNTVHLTEILL